MLSPKNSGIDPEEVLEKRHSPLKFKVTEDVAYDMIRIDIIDPKKKRAVQLRITREALECAQPGMIASYIRTSIKQFKNGTHVGTSVHPYYNPSSRNGYDN